MKKLMIAAAAAAMVGGVQAAVAQYDFVANLRTTAGRAGVAQYTYEAANLGTDGQIMWYNDGALLRHVNTQVTPWAWNTPADYPNLEWATKKTLGGATIPTLGVSNPQKLLTAKEAKLIKDLATKYNRQSYGMWCAQLAWYTVTPAQCFRVLGSDSIVETVTLNDQFCCAAGTMQFVNEDQTAFITFEKVNGFVFNRFGAQTADQANLVEICAGVAGFRTKISDLVFTGVLAGQGTQAIFNGANFPRAIQGMIVGQTAAPVCPDCCVLPLPRAIAFECLASATANDTLNTAAYGTFYLQLKGVVQP